MSWKSGHHPLKDDFKNQYALSQALGFLAKMTLVVSQKEVYDTLVEEMPDDIKAFTEVVHFETATSMNNLIRNNSLVREALINMCALTNPSADKLESLGSVLLGVWDSTDKSRVSLREISDKSRNLNPNYIRGHSNILSDKLNRILHSIPDFSFTVENGFLKWTFQLTDEGVLAYRIGSIEFEQWESDVFNAAIKNFEDLESFLSS